MFADFDGGQISRTDYFQSRDRDEGRAWLIVQGGCWHVLIPPRFSCHPTVALARPVVDHDELEGWRWRLEIAGHRLQLHASCSSSARSSKSSAWSKSSRKAGCHAGPPWRMPAMPDIPTGNGAPLHRLGKHCGQCLLSHPLIALPTL